MSEKQGLRVTNPDENKDPFYSNTFRVSFTETEFVLEFGLMIPDKDEINVGSKISLPTEKMLTLIMRLFQSARNYEDKYKKDIGFAITEEEETEED